MWILPNNLETVPQLNSENAFSLGTHELSLLCESSLTMKSKTMLARAWLRAWLQEKGYLKQHVWGRVLKASHKQRFISLWVADSIGLLIEYTTTQNPPTTPTLKKSWTIGALHYLETSDFVSALHTWGRWVVVQRRSITQRQKLAQGTKSAADFWGTPTTMICLPPRSVHALLKRMTGGARPWRKGSGNLNEQVIPHLEERVYVIGQQIKKQLTERSISTDSASQTTQITHFMDDSVNTAPQIRLSSRWVEALMGLPVGWVSPNCREPQDVQAIFSVMSRHTPCDSE